MGPQRTILVLEDEALVGLDMAEQLNGAGYCVAGPFARVDDALSSISVSPPDAAVLDINLGPGITSEPVAAALEQRSIPYVFLSGYSENAPQFGNLSRAMFLTKPCSPDKLIGKVQSLLDAS